LAGTTKTTPASNGSSACAVRTGSVLRRERISFKLLSLSGSRCWAMTRGAGKSSGRAETSSESVFIPPAEEPTTTNREKDFPDKTLLT
jgi:hypothetical protein